jgi:hypothetical protein
MQTLQMLVSLVLRTPSRWCYHTIYLPTSFVSEERPPLRMLCCAEGFFTAFSLTQNSSTKPKLKKTNPTGKDRLRHR